MLNTTQLRSAWAPPCTGPWAKIRLHGEGAVTVRPAIVDAVRALNAALIRWDYRTRSGDTGAYNCRRITGGTGYSLHAYGIALDLNWTTNPYKKPPVVTDMDARMIADIKGIHTGNGKQVWRWGGDYKGNVDSMHYEVVCTPADLMTGIVGMTTPPVLPPEEDEMAALLMLAQVTGRAEIFLTDGLTKTHQVTDRMLGGTQIVLTQRGLNAEVVQVAGEWLDPIPQNVSAETLVDQAVAKILQGTSAGGASPDVIADAVRARLSAALSG